MNHPRRFRGQIDIAFRTLIIPGMVHLRLLQVCVLSRTEKLIVLLPNLYFMYFASPIRDFFNLRDLTKDCLQVT